MWNKWSWKKSTRLTVTYVINQQTKCQTLEVKQDHASVFLYTSWLYYIFFYYRDCFDLKTTYGCPKRCERFWFSIDFSVLIQLFWQNRFFLMSEQVCPLCQQYWGFGNLYRWGTSNTTEFIFKDVPLLFMIDVVPINNIREVYFPQKMFRNLYEGPVGYSFKMIGGGLSQI